MKTEKEKMLAGELYHSKDPELKKDALRTRNLLKQFNDSRSEEEEFRGSILRELLGSIGEETTIYQTFYCDYGYNIHLGNRVFMNFGCILLDVNTITIGDDTLLAPNVQLYSATHPLDWRIRRNFGPELGEPITIGSNCWLGGGVVVCPGVSIGNRTVIGAGSVVTKDIPPDSLAVGNPARVIRKL